MDITEGIIRHAAKKVAGDKVEFINIFDPEGEKIDISKEQIKAIAQNAYDAAQKGKEDASK